VLAVTRESYCYRDVVGLQSKASLAHTLATKGALMSSADSITHWLTQLQAGDADAATRLWEHYSEHMTNLARKRLAGTSQRMADDEDVASSAFCSFCAGVQANRFPNLEDRDSLWRLLVVITARKAIDLVEYNRRPKHGGGRLKGESAFLSADGPDNPGGIDEVAGREQPPEFAAQVNDELERLLAILSEPELKQIARWKLENYANEEIATKLDCALRTIERKLQRIRDLWKHEVPS
jgi:DNA-directed RNA polymerase specialized sigma24 family protein